MIKVEAFTLHNGRGQSVLRCALNGWVDEINPGNDIFGPVLRYSWLVGDERYEICDAASDLNLNELPDATGFIGFEAGWKPNNCVLFDVFGKERMRLTVPWKLTRPQNPESAKPPTTFVGVSPPFVNPSDAGEGRFGVNAWVEHAGTYYFEFDYHTGQFLWGTGIRD